LKRKLGCPGGLPIAALVCLSAALMCACGGASGATSTIPRAVVRQARPIGSGPRFHPPARGPVIGPCRKRLGQRSGVHIEVFAANRVTLVPAGIGTMAPRSWAAGRVTAARCYGSLVTLDPTGLVLVRPGARLSLLDLFRSWGEPLSRSVLASFSASGSRGVVVFVDGRRWRGQPESVPLTRHAEIVAEIGPLVPPHPSYTFPPGT
jgi:hypothetical protein